MEEGNDDYFIQNETLHSKSAGQKKSSDCYFGYLAVRFGKILLLGFLQELRPSCNGQYDAVCHPVVVQTELHGSLIVSSQQGLRYQAVQI